jgi:hypothetical protein
VPESTVNNLGGESGFLIVLIVQKFQAVLGPERRVAEIAACFNDWRRPPYMKKF